MAALLVSCAPDPGPPAQALRFDGTGPLTLAAAGDLVMAAPAARADEDAGVDAIAALIRGASLAVTNLEMNLLAPDRAAGAAGDVAGWTFGSAREAATIRALGFDLVGQANNHATDYGPDGPGPDGWYKIELYGHVTHNSPGWFDGFAIRASGPPT